MNIQQRVREFLATYQTTGWILLFMAGGLLFQGVVYILVNLSKNPQLYQAIIGKFVLPADGKTFISQPWSILTFPLFSVRGSLLSLDLFGLLIDGIILWMFGRIHQQLLNDDRTRRLSIIAVPIIGLLTVLLCVLLPVTEGAPVYVSGIAPVMICLVISAISLVPDYPVQLFLFGRVKILWVGLVLLVLELFAAAFFTPAGIAVMIGAGLGFLHIYLLKRGFDLTENIWAFYQDKSPGQPRMKVKHGSPKRREPEDKRSSKGSSEDEVSQEVIDRILDKISDEGYESLSRREKEILFKASSKRDGDQSP
ncbi:MAG: DUF6576 domain-containing protein [Bacteroidota bacterium]